MAPTIGKVNKEKHQDNNDKTELDVHLRKSDTKNYESMKNLGNRVSAIRATSNNSNYTSQNTANRFSSAKVPSTPERKQQSWKPTAVRDKSLDKSFALIVQSQNESNMVKYQDKNDLTSDSKNKSLTRVGEESLINRLYKEDLSKQSAKKKFYEQEKLRRDTAACTFAPNTSAKNTYGQSNQLAISLYTDENKTEIKSIIKKAQNFDNDSEIVTPDELKKIGKIAARTARSTGKGDTKFMKQSIPEEGTPVNNRDASQTSGGVSRKQQEDLADYLAYHGVKNMKAQELEKIKVKEDLASCTFKPQILNYKAAKST